MPAGEYGWPSSNFLPHVPSEEGEQTKLIDALQDWKSDKYRELIGEPLFHVEPIPSRNKHAKHKHALLLCAQKKILQQFVVVPGNGEGLVVGCLRSRHGLLAPTGPLRCSQQQPVRPCMSPRQLVLRWPGARTAASYSGHAQPFADIVLVQSQISCMSG